MGEVDRTVPVRTLWLAFTKESSKGNLEVEASHKPSRRYSKVLDYPELQASRNGGRLEMEHLKGRARDPLSRGILPDQRQKVGLSKA